jgi:hypothetical protein
MGISSCCLGVCMAYELLNNQRVNPKLKQPGDCCMPEGMEQQVLILNTKVTLLRSKFSTVS